jgi:hypothetical protein
VYAAEEPSVASKAKERGYFFDAKKKNTTTITTPSYAHTHSHRPNEADRCIGWFDRLMVSVMCDGLVDCYSSRRCIAMRRISESRIQTTANLDCSLSMSRVLSTSMVMITIDGGTSTTEIACIDVLSR